MTRLLSHSAALVIAAGCLLPAAGRASTLFQFTYGPTGSTSTVTSGYLTALNESITAVTISGAAQGNGTYSVSSGSVVESSAGSGPDTFTFSGTIAGLGGGNVSGAFLTYTSGASTATTAGSNYLVSYGAGTALLNTATAAYLNLETDLGTAFMGSPAVSGSLIVSKTSPGTVSSDTLAVSLSATPEPASFLLLGSGLLAALLTIRRRSIPRQASLATDKYR